MIRPASPRAPAFAWWTSVAGLIGALLVFELTPLDLLLQDCFYDFARQSWLVDGREPWGRLFFYNGPKFAIIVLGVVLLTFALGPARWRERLMLPRRALFVAFLTLATVPALAGFGKSLTNTFCPSEIRRYGGDVPYVKVFASYPPEDRPERRGRGFPAGHASGGFALLGLAWLRPSRRWRTAVVVLALAVGWWMGLYQMLKGAHYLSHTVVTMLLAWIVALSWRLALYRKRIPCASA